VRMGRQRVHHVGSIHDRQQRPVLGSPHILRVTILSW
jgi:hypothetical protein